MGKLIGWSRCKFCDGSGLELKIVEAPPFPGEMTGLETCVNCGGSGLEPLKVQIPSGRIHCPACGGFGKVIDRMFLTPTKMICEFCGGSGLEPIRDPLPLGKKYCPKCQGFKKVQFLGAWITCFDCLGSGIAGRF
jgi:DnaJ-class molecular chaperone